jgi:hypothetical protein
MLIYPYILQIALQSNTYLTSYPRFYLCRSLNASSPACKSDSSQVMWLFLELLAQSCFSTRPCFLILSLSRILFYSYIIQISFQSNIYLTSYLRFYFRRSLNSSSPNCLGFLIFATYLLTLPNHPSTTTTFSHLELIIEQGKWVSIIENRKRVCKNKKWVKSIEYIMNRKKTS